jgi:hypothetical protein
MTELSGPYLLALPLVLAMGLAFAWILWSRPASPPRFHGYVVRQSWQIDPLAFLERDLREGQFTRGILSVRDRLLVELHERHGLSPTRVRRRLRSARVRQEPTIERACQEVRALEKTYSIAFRAEDPSRTDLWSRWRKPVWRERARSRFEMELTEVETLWPLLEAAR